MPTSHGPLDGLSHDGMSLRYSRAPAVCPQWSAAARVITRLACKQLMTKGMEETPRSCLYSGRGEGTVVSLLEATHKPSLQRPAGFTIFYTDTLLDKHLDKREESRFLRGRWVKKIIILRARWARNAKWQLGRSTTWRPWQRFGFESKIDWVRLVTREASR